MLRELAEFIEAGSKLSEAWEEERVTEYPDGLPEFDELLVLLSMIRVVDREDALIVLLDHVELWDVSTDWRDAHSGAMFIYGSTRSCWVGIDYGINGSWSVNLYWRDPRADTAEAVDDGREYYTPIDLGSDGLNLKADASATEAFEKIGILIRALKGGAVVVR
jgi:hypothetical protein